MSNLEIIFKSAGIREKPCFLQSNQTNQEKNFLSLLERFKEEHLSEARRKEEKDNERFDPDKRHLFQIEIPNTMFTLYLYESRE